MEESVDRQKIIDRLEGLTGIYADWSSLTTEQLERLLDILKHLNRLYE